MTKALTICIEGPVEIRLGFVETVRLTCYVIQHYTRLYENLSRQDIQNLVIQEALRRRGIRKIVPIDDIGE
jgi:hypothetical protein